MKINRNNTVIQYRFSLVEILVAIAIIAILLGLSGAGYTAVQRKIARSRTEATLNKLRVGLESYKSKFGYYPQQQNIRPFHLDQNDFRTPLTAPQGLPQNNFNSCIEYGKMSQEDSFVESVLYTYQVFNNGVPSNVDVCYYRIIDGWKTPIKDQTGSDAFQVPGKGGGPFILYMCPGLVNTSSYDLFSAGNDRTFRWSVIGDVTDSVNTDNIWPQGLKQK